jgi:hypothetical protein
MLLQGSVRLGFCGHNPDAQALQLAAQSGPLESVTIRCPVGHYFIAPVEFLSLEGDPAVPERPLSSG